MKRLISVIAFFVSITVTAQGPANDSIYLDTTAHTPIYIDIDAKYDTIPIIYLWCDTASPTYTYREWAKDTMYQVWGPFNTVHWSMGYEVVKVEKDFWYTVDGGHIYVPSENRHIEYLDLTCRQLSKSIIVWQTKRVSKEK